MKPLIAFPPIGIVCCSRSPHELHRHEARAHRTGFVHDGARRTCRKLDVKKHAAKFDDADWDEKPTHSVAITQPFAMSATEVTQAQFRQFKPKHNGGRGADDDAVNNVTWDQAVAFCEWLSKKEGKTLSSAHGSGVGVCLPRGHDDAFQHGRQVAQRLALVAHGHRLAGSLLPR